MKLIPARRLMLLWAVVILLAVLGAFSAHVFTAMKIAIAALAVVCVADALVSWKLLDEIDVVPGLTASTSAELIRMSQRSASDVPFEIRQKRVRARLLRVALQVAGETGFGLPEEPTELHLPAEPRVGSQVHFEPARRGRYRGLLFGLETLSHLGLWRMRSRQTLPTEIRVYPDLRQGRRSVLVSPLYRALSGAHQKPITGTGRDFERLREYLPGDSYSDLAWKATARRASPVTRVFQREQLQEIYIAVDHSRLSGLPAGARTLLDLYIETALIAGATSYELGDQFGLITFSDRVTRLIRAGSGAAHFGLCREALLNLQPAPVSPDYAALFTRIRAGLRRRCLLLVLTDLSERAFAEPFLQAAQVVRSAHLLAVQSRMPSRTGPLFSQHAGEVETVDGIYRRLAGHREYLRLQELRRLFMLRGFTLAFPGDEQFLRSSVDAYLETKRRQLL